MNKLIEKHLKTKYKLDADIRVKCGDSSRQSVRECKDFVIIESARVFNTSIFETSDEDWALRGTAAEEFMR